ncbi:MMPL domain protein OS=Tsukamurella paurometabola (strain ATCC 8368 / DSM / CCUG 35730 / CIP 100753 / JCM 10117 / KCTC 9821 / NBRC 16120 / NCIMB 702349/ NCTC 13040) OX=521096 GN=Tpau_0724 PE=4 SV=1 [Tsukamurella paurometabola]|uniref:MMPL domain protein n=1 Tax=Tsukamurella paurometabola (strain ATCC 8368 / DSM 20162 / CCUG 35730 / CIP 100753 / JCM 10117 / KCTC 9821 / NBRC 16120 / NCIMB 702349 / NCTC 13040) TaxID=521096 RepID=D5UTK7_TSUPD|nr:MMPL family transporter [Tsukamurella paurometabola]ADG77361.1 MMPL domain protein [Tsukamurella paurometabola DSM 20162]SUP26667.1 Putative membrane protein ydgH [Tsukamurella paurometabola]
MPQSTHDAPSTTARPSTPGPLARLGGWVVDHRRGVSVVWVLAIIALGVFAPFVEKNLSGAGWQANGSESVQAREAAQAHFGGNASHAIQVVVSSTGATLDRSDGPRVLARVTEILRADPRIGEIIAPQPGASLSADGRTAVILGGAGADTNEMVRAATDLKDPLRAVSVGDITVSPTGSSMLWSDFNAANLSAMLKSEMLSWPVTLAILVLAFGTLVAAGLPLALTLAGLVASAGSLVLINEIVPVSIWAMNFAMMFSLALGIDYALFLVVRYRAARMEQRLSRRDSIAQMMDTAGKAVLLSGITVLISLSAVMLVPSPSFRSMAGGIMLSVVFILAATLTLLPVILFALDMRINKLPIPWAQAATHRSPRFESWGNRLWRNPLAWGGGALAILIALAVPVVGLKTAMPSITVLPENASARVGYDEVQRAFGPGAPGTLQIVVPTAEAPAAGRVLRADPGIAGAVPAIAAADASGLSLISAVPAVDPSDPALTGTVDRLRDALPGGALVGGAAVENIDLKKQLDTSTPLVIGIVLALGFVLLLVALRAPLIALLGTVVSLLSTAAAFGVARLIFQDGIGAALLGFEPQGFLDAWAPVFFFAMIFAIAMDYTVFLLSSAKEHWERTGDPQRAMVGAMAQSGRVIFAAGGVMVAVFFTFALSGPLPPKEMGVILGIAVLLDTFLVRLILLPVLLRLAGPRAWACPAPLARVLPNISFAHD